MTTFSYSQINTWVQQYAPRVIFHPDEPYFPSNVEWFLDRTCLVSRTANNVNEKKDCEAQTQDGDPICPSSDCENFSTFSQCSYFNIIEKDFSETQKGDLSTAICYVHVIGVNGYIELQYLFFSPFNGGGFGHFEADTFFGKSSNVDTSPKGDHQGDWEHITVRISTSGAFIAAFYAQHSVGSWFKQASGPSQKDGITFVSGQHPVVYCGFRAHASYPWAGSFTLYKKNKDGIVTDPSVSLGLLTIGGVDITGNGKSWDTWTSTNSLQIMQIDGLEVSGDLSTKPNWLQFKGMWGGPYSIRYQRKTLIASIAAFMAAAPLYGVIIVAIFVSIGGWGGLLGWLLGGGVGMILGALGFTLAGLEIVFFILRQIEFKDGTSWGPEPPTSKSYWRSGEPLAYSTGTAIVKNGNSEVKVKFCPGRAITVYDSTTTHYVLYSDRSGNSLWYHTGSDGVHWSGRKQVPDVDIHCSPAPVFYESRQASFLYVFWQDSHAEISYSVWNGTTWNNHTLSEKMLFNYDMSVTILDHKLYLVYRDSSKYLKMKSGIVDNTTGLVTWTDLDVDPSITTIDTDPSIATVEDYLLITYKKSSVSYMWQYVDVIVRDDGVEVKAEWKGPSTFTSTVLATVDTPQPIVVHGQLFLIFYKSTDKKDKTNIFAASMKLIGATYIVSSTSSLGIEPITDHKMGLVSGLNAPLYLAFRKSESEHIYTSISYI